MLGTELNSTRGGGRSLSKFSVVSIRILPVLLWGGCPWSYDHVVMIQHAPKCRDMFCVLMEYVQV